MAKRRVSKKGYFRPRNPKKYLGDPTNIVWRSTWERKVMQYLDQNTNVVAWASDGLGPDCTPTNKSGLAIPYISPVDNSVRRYFPDFYVEIKTDQGLIKKYLLEVKPYKETLEPVAPAKPTQKYIKECMTYGINQAKWKNAADYCRHKGWEFRIITERELGLKHK